jgi:hypothetical protein
MKNPNDPIGNRTRNLSACSAVPQPNAPPRAPLKFVRQSVVTLVFHQISHRDFNATSYGWRVRTHKLKVKRKMSLLWIGECNKRGVSYTRLRDISYLIVLTLSCPCASHDDINGADI